VTGGGAVSGDVTGGGAASVGVTGGGAASGGVTGGGAASGDVTGGGAASGDVTGDGLGHHAGVSAMVAELWGLRPWNVLWSFRTFDSLTVECLVELPGIRHHALIGMCSGASGPWTSCGKWGGRRVWLLGCDDYCRSSTEATIVYLSRLATQDSNSRGERNETTCESVAKYGYLEVLKWAWEHDCPGSETTCPVAAMAAAAAAAAAWRRLARCCT